MSSQLPLSPGAIAHLLPLSDWQRTSDLLSGRVPEGYLDASCLYSVEVARAAHLVWIAWRRGWTAGMLKGRPSFEALELLAHRVRSARSSAGSLEQWGAAVVEGVGARMSSLSGSEALWWRRTYAADSADEYLGAGVWDAIRSPEGTDQVIEAAGFIIDWHRQVRNMEREA